MRTELVAWDPTQLEGASSASPFAKTAASVTSPKRRQSSDAAINHSGAITAEEEAAQMASLSEIRDRLQRAIIVGDRFNCVERQESKAEAYSPVSLAPHKVLGDATSDVLYASNGATALLLSRQFESVSRKDLMLLEMEERQAMCNAFFLLTRATQHREHAAKVRRLQDGIDEGRRREADLRTQITSRVVELETACRRRTEACTDELSSMLDLQLRRVLSVLKASHIQTQRSWIGEQEDHARHHVMLEADRGMAKMANQALTEKNAALMRILVKEVAPHTATALVEQQTKTGSNSTATHFGSRGEGRSLLGDGAAASGGRDGATDDDDFVSPSEPQPIAVDESDTSSQGGPRSDMQDNPSTFTPYWGWMEKSTGVLMTWQRRFFVFTTRGKLKIAVSEKGPFTVLFTANQILRVEVDTYHDVLKGARPPTSQYTQYGFYVDISDPSVTAKQRRLRFCCHSRALVNSWLTVLRRAADVVFALEDSGTGARAPARRRFDTVMASATHVAADLRRSLTGGNADATSGGPSSGKKMVSYRRRVQLEGDLAALEAAQQRQRGAQAGSPPGRSPSGDSASTFGKPPVVSEAPASPTSQGGRRHHAAGDGSPPQQAWSMYAHPTLQ